MRMLCGLGAICGEKAAGERRGVCVCPGYGWNVHAREVLLSVELSSLGVGGCWEGIAECSPLKVSQPLSGPAGLKPDMHAYR